MTTASIMYCHPSQTGYPQKHAGYGSSTVNANNLPMNYTAHHLCSISVADTSFSHTTYHSSTLPSGQIRYLQSQYAPPVQIQRFSDVYHAHYTHAAGRAKHVRTHAHINRLPAETLALIFWKSIDDPYGCPVERLMAVCSAWMTICMSTPQLWTKIRLSLTHWSSVPRRLYEMRNNYVFHHLSRSGILPMDVAIDLVPNANLSVDPRANVHLSQGVLQLLFNGDPIGKSSKHWRALTVSYDASTPRRLLDFVAWSLPSLQQLSLKGPSSSRLPVLDLPSLTALESVNGLVPPGVQPTQLTSLVLRDVDLCGDGVDLSQFENLTHLSLYKCTNDPQMRRVTLPKLTTLDVRTPLLMSLRFLILPQLSTLTAAFEDRCIQSVNTLRNLGGVKRLLFAEYEWPMTVCKRTEWGFSAYYDQPLEAMRLRPGIERLERLAYSCPLLEFMGGLPLAVSQMTRIIRPSRASWPGLRL